MQTLTVEQVDQVSGGEWSAGEYIGNGLITGGGGLGLATAEGATLLAVGVGGGLLVLGAVAVGYGVYKLLT